MIPPKRIQRKREKGWRKPEGAVYVGRGSRWGNPYRVGDLNPYSASEEHPDGLPATAEEVVALYQMGVMFLPAELFLPLAGKDLMCWCDESEPCHADVLLEIANAPYTDRRD